MAEKPINENKLVAAHLAAVILQDGSRSTGPNSAAVIYFDCLEAIEAEAKKRGRNRAGTF